MMSNNSTEPNYKIMNSASSAAREMERAERAKFTQQAIIEKALLNTMQGNSNWDNKSSIAPRVLISEEAKNLLTEIIENENAPEYWKNKFSRVNYRDDAILRSKFSELERCRLIKVQWADGTPCIIAVLGDGYLYYERMIEEANPSKFEKEVHGLLQRANKIKSTADGVNLNNGFNSEIQIWINDFEIFSDKYLKSHTFNKRIESILFHRTPSTFDDLFAILKSISTDTEYINRMNGMTTTEVPSYQAKTVPEYDVFLSHANKDKEAFVDDLYNSLCKLGVKIFYDKEELEWGDDWKQKIYNGTSKSEFAIIVISENFFDREWTEKELKEFLNRQNRNGQKLILPILHNITMEQLRDKYPSIADIQAIDSSKYECDHIALLFAKQLIKRLKYI